MQIRIQDPETAMKKLEMVQLDVFTERALTGNALAVCLDGRGLSTEQMQALARETKMPILSVARGIVQDPFRSAKRLSRFDIARLVAERYPELALRLPEVRKLGHAEPFQLRMFNAAATGMAFLHISHRPANEVSWENPHGHAAS